MQVVYNKDCSTYNIHMLYSMMKVRNENYRLKELGYVPILKCMEYVSNSDFVRRFDEETATRPNYYDFWSEKNVLYGEKIYVDCSTISGINVKFVEPDDIFERIITKITWDNLFKIIEMTINLGYLRCFRHVIQYYKVHCDEFDWRYLIWPTKTKVENKTIRVGLLYFVSVFLEDLGRYLRGKPKFGLIYKEYFPQ